MRIENLISLEKEKQQMSRKVIKGMLWLFILLIAIALIGCAPSKAKGKIKIGVIGPQTGASAETGQAVSKAPKLPPT